MLGVTVDLRDPATIYEAVGPAVRADYLGSNAVFATGTKVRDHRVLHAARERVVFPPSCERRGRGVSQATPARQRRVTRPRVVFATGTRLRHSPSREYAPHRRA